MKLETLTDCADALILSRDMLGGIDGFAKTLREGGVGLPSLMIYKAAGKQIFEVAQRIEAIMKEARS